MYVLNNPVLTLQVDINGQNSYCARGTGKLYVYEVPLNQHIECYYYTFCHVVAVYKPSPSGTYTNKH